MVLFGEHRVLREDDIDRDTFRVVLLDKEQMRDDRCVEADHHVRVEEWLLQLLEVLLRTNRVTEHVEPETDLHLEHDLCLVEHPLLLRPDTKSHVLRLFSSRRT